jgi:ribonuclease HII
VAAAVVLPPEYRITRLRDSKLLTPAMRATLDLRIREKAIAFGIGVVEVKELNQNGFPWALRQSGIRAIQELAPPPDRILLDGHHNYLGEEYDCETIIGGDATELCIAAASIIAKVHRDTLMTELADAHPEYGFAAHKGYGTAQHRKALKEHGPCDHHRSQWKPISELLQQQLL